MFQPHQLLKACGMWPLPHLQQRGVEFSQVASLCPSPPSSTLNDSVITLGPPNSG